MKRAVDIFKSKRKQEMYLYVDQGKGLEDVPADLLARFGEPERVMTLLLDHERKLARADAAEVLAKIDKQGFYLQMPPTAAELLARDGSRD
jgi:uncharacterized protein YcgL (UPF0745 family)